MLKVDVIDSAELKDWLTKLIDWRALGIHVEGRDILIAYVMNDAVECYIRLLDVKVQGEIDEMNDYGDAEVEMIEDNGFILMQYGNVTTIWYEEARKILGLYPYHIIGHRWRKNPGEEYIRRLINLICVLNDKKSYLGEEHCNEDEIWLADLAEFAPFIYFTPINESITDWYPSTMAGIDAARKLAFSAGDASFLEAIDHYEKACIKGRAEKQIEKIANLLLQKEHQKLWMKLDDLIEHASKDFDERYYGEAFNNEILNVRCELESSYKEQGFSGSYPRFEKTDADGKTLRINLYEQQAFTVLESDEFEYKFFEEEIVDNDILNAKWTTVNYLKD